MEQYMLFFDIDGTLLDEKEGIVISFLIGIITAAIVFYMPCIRQRKTDIYCFFVPDAASPSGQRIFWKLVLMVW